MKFKSKPFVLLFLTIFCLVGLETQTVLLHIKSFDTSQGHACGCNETDVWRMCDDADDWRNCCCCSKMSSSDVPVQSSIAYIVKTLRCQDVHTDILVSHLTQYEPLTNKIIAYILADSGTLLPQRAKKPLEPYLSPPYKPPKYLPDAHFLT